MFGQRKPCKKFVCTVALIDSKCGVVNYVQNINYACALLTVRKIIASVFARGWGYLFEEL